LVMTLSMIVAMDTDVIIRKRYDRFDCLRVEQFCILYFCAEELQRRGTCTLHF
jgi:hypothetical protein